MNEQTEAREPLRLLKRITKADFNTEPEHTLTARQIARVERFMRFHIPPPPDAHIDAIIVPGTSPIFDAESLKMRTDAATAYANAFPDASIVISGWRPDKTRATPEELAPGYSEAKIIQSILVENGVAAGRMTLEEKAKHTGENIANSLDLLFGRNNTKAVLHTNHPAELLIVCSSYFGRRIDLYMKREVRNKSLADQLKYYIYDADVQEDFDRTQAGDQAQSLSPEAEKRKRRHMFREARRVSLYRNSKQI